jgi:hypothetical protein
VAYYERGLVRYQLQDQEGAISDWQKTLRTDVTHRDARRQLCRVQRELATTKLAADLELTMAEFYVGVTVVQSAQHLTVTLTRPLHSQIHYVELAEVLRVKLGSMGLDHINRVKIQGQRSDSTQPEWQASYSFKASQPCPRPYWGAAGVVALAFPPLGLAALVASSQVTRHYQLGHHGQALRSSQAAKNLSVIGGSLGGFAYLLVLGVLGASTVKPSLGCGPGMTGTAVPTIERCLPGTLDHAVDPDRPHELRGGQGLPLRES